MECMGNVHVHSRSQNHFGIPSPLVFFHVPKVRAAMRIIGLGEASALHRLIFPVQQECKRVFNAIQEHVSSKPKACNIFPCGFMLI